jgi:hypothetical protein
MELVFCGEPYNHGPQTWPLDFRFFIFKIALQRGYIEDASREAAKSMPPLYQTSHTCALPTQLVYFHFSFFF